MCRWNFPCVCIFARMNAVRIRKEIQVCLRCVGVGVGVGVGVCVCVCVCMHMYVCPVREHFCTDECSSSPYA